MENHHATRTEQLVLVGKQDIFDGPEMFDQDIAETIEIIQFEPISSIEAQDLDTIIILVAPLCYRCCYMIIGPLAQYPNPALINTARHQYRFERDRTTFDSN